MIVLLNIIILTALATWMHHRTHVGSTRLFVFLLALKVAAGILVGLLYTYHYPGGDTFLLYEDAAQLATLLKTGPLTYLSALFYSGDEWYGRYGIQIVFHGEPRALWFSKLISPVAAIAQGYYMTAVYLSVFSFWASLYLYNTFRKIFSARPLPLFILLFAYPSFIFWTSGVMKETIAISFLLILTSHALYIRYGKLSIISLKLLISLFMLAWLAVVKYYVLACLLPCVFLVIVGRFIPDGVPFRWWKITVSWLILGFVGFYLAGFLHPNLAYGEIMSALRLNHDANIRQSLPGTFALYDWGSPFILILHAQWNAFFGPQFWQVSGWLPMLLAAENALIFLGFLYGLFLVRKVSLASWYPEMVLPAISYTFILGTMLALASPNFGTLARYKVYYMPLLVGFILFQVFEKQRVPVYQEEIHKHPRV